MDQHTTTEQAYKNGYEQGQKDAIKKFVKKVYTEVFPEDGCGWDCVYMKDIYKIAKQFGVKKGDCK